MIESFHAYPNNISPLGTKRSIETSMRWRDQRQSSNVEDRRGMGRGVALGGGGIGVLILAAIVCLLGGDPRQFLEGAGQQQ